MTLKKNGLNDSDKIVVTIALWITAITLFITALTLPMLPSEVTIFYRAEALDMPEKYSKYNNLYLVLIALVPMVIIVISAVLKKNNRLQNNFMSVMLFSVMLSISISCIIIYGITQQFGASGGINDVNIHGVIVLTLSFILSLFFSLFPALYHRPDVEHKSSRLKSVLDRYWAIGAFGFLAVAMAACFVPLYYTYIPFAGGLIAYIVFAAVCKTSASDKTDKTVKVIENQEV